MFTVTVVAAVAVVAVGDVLIIAIIIIIIVVNLHYSQITFSHALSKNTFKFHVSFVANIFTFTFQ